MLHESALMPQTADFPFIACAIAAPCVQLCRRQNGDISGAIAGLGMDSFQQMATHPDHDIEIEAMTDCTDEDIKSVSFLFIYFLCSIFFTYFFFKSCQEK